MPGRPIDPLVALARLVETEVEFIVVGYDELLPHTVERDVDGHTLRLLDLQTLIEVKTAADREKDKLGVAHLLRILEKQKP